MSGTHTGNIVPEITREEHRSVNGVNAKAVAPYGFDGTNLQPLKTDNTGQLYLANPGSAATPTVVQYGHATISVTSTAVQLASNAVAGVIIQALSGNTASIYVGDSSVTSSNGFELQPGQATAVAIDNTNRLYINGTASDGICFIGS